MQLIPEKAVERRQFWIAEIKKLSGKFSDDFAKLTVELKAEFVAGGSPAMRSQLRLCGSIPENYGHDSSEEKLYSKYTDFLVAEAFNSIGIKSLVLTERADAADVECVAGDYGFVADAKAFRLSRTAKNAKDFKVQAMHGWKRGNEFAMIVCPLYQMPARSSQIYKQAIDRNVCLFSFSHLSLLSAFAELTSPDKARALLKKEFNVVSTLHPSKDSSAYWQAINRTIVEFHPDVRGLWHEEKVAASEALIYAKEEGLSFLAQERRRLLHMSHDEALKELLVVHKLESRAKVIENLLDNGLMGVV